MQQECAQLSANRVKERLSKLSSTEKVKLVQAYDVLKNSISLRDKIIPGKFIGFDDTDATNSVMMLLGFQNEYLRIPTANVVTVLDGNWVVADR